MKNLIAFVLGLMPFLGFGQDLDSLRVVREVDSLVKITWSHINTGEFDKAHIVIDTARYISENKFGIQSSKYANCTFIKGIIFHYSGLYSSAEPLFIKNIEIQAKLFGKEHAEYAKGLNALANVYYETGRYDECEKLYLQVKTIRENALGVKHPAYAQVISNLGLVYHTTGNFDKSEQYYLKAKEISEKSSGKRNENYAIIIKSLADVYSDKGNYDIAFPIYNEALSIQEEVLGKLHPHYAWTLNDLAMAYRNKRQYEKALPLYQEYLAITEKTTGKDHPDYAISLLNVALLYDNIGQLDTALSMVLEAKRIWKQFGNTSNASYVRILNNLASTNINRGDYEAATSALLEAKSVVQDVFGWHHPDYALILENLSLAYTGQNNNSMAAKSYIECNMTTKSLLSNVASYSTEEEIIKYQNKFKKRFNELYHFSSLHPIDSIRIAVFENTIFLKNGLIGNAIAREKGIAQADSSTRALHAEWKSSRFQLGKLYSQPVAERNLALVAQLEELSNKYEKELVRRSPQFAETRKEVFWNDVKSSLQKGEVAMEFVNYSWYDRKQMTDTTMYAALLLLPNSPAPAFIPLCSEDELLAALATPTAEKQGYYDRLYRGIKPKAGQKSSEGLYQLLWQPLDSILRGVKRVYYAPAGLLHRINLAAIPAPQPPKGGEGGTVGSKYELVQLGSTRQLVIKNEQRYTAKNAVVLGGIRYDTDNQPVAKQDSLAQAEDDLTFGSSTNFGDLTRNLRGGEWNYLEGTEIEATDIAKLLKKKGFQVQRQGGHTATEEAFKAIGQGSVSPRVLHMATHGFFFPDAKTGERGETVFQQSDNPMIRAGLILADANTAWKGGTAPVGKEDGILTAYEISQMNLSNTELVVLSACETGLGDIEGNEGVYGLQRAFKIAGAKHLMMSLWDVPDAETAEFMAHFYKEWLSGKDIYDAFRNTQQVMREAYPNEPYLWAGWVLVE